MLTSEGAGDDGVTIRPDRGGGWRVQIPRSDGRTLVSVVRDRQVAIDLAHRLSPNADIRLLPSDESFQTLSDDLSNPPPGAEGHATARKRPMIVVITAHEAALNGDEDSHRFHFLVHDDEGGSRKDSVTLRTAKVLVRELPNRTALDAVMRAIVGTSPTDYDSLTGIRFQDR